jgi:hypothetical protein
VSPTPSPEDGNISSFQNLVFFSVFFKTTRQWAKSKNPLILIALKYLKGMYVKFTYLGMMVTYKNYIFEEIKRRLNSDSIYYNSFQALVLQMAT